ncbi:mechanosensitive ion channel-like protein family [Lentithecium fluviatile CBS 122367]|uniref:Mechanosensitive ion channel-like protein family n=1 Tax=Lentithecium fluviatile CBS 122367 TaxID=1168545 RepID=A0A6G1IW24_9PLEO|nr:mechanosensitive ion channel-like protein family [Lentithecium fluviatile CBS 122367]
MTTPDTERPEPTYEMHSNTHVPQTCAHQRSSDDDGTFVGDDLSRQGSRDGAGYGGARARAGSHLTVETAHMEPTRSLASPSQTREQASRLDDDLALLQIERQISHQDELNREQSQSRSIRRQRSRRPDPVDEFDEATNPLHEKAALYKPPENPSTGFSKFFKKVHNSSFLVRYFTYITPVVLIILIPLLLGALLFEDASVGGVKMVWFCIWLQIVWLTLWAGRLLAKCLPWPIGLVSSLFTNNSKKWRDMGKQLELPATLFFWWLAIEVSFLPTMKNHSINGDKSTKHWQSTMNKVLISIFVGMTLNFIEKIIIQLIAISFHLRTYADRIELNKFQIGSLAKLYKFSKEKIAVEDSEFESRSDPASGARTPGQIIKEAQKNTKEAFSKFGDVAGKVAGDFTGRQVAKSNHPHQVVLTLLGSTGGSQVLARRLYRTFAREETETVHSEDLKNAFENDDEAEAAFSMFDKDMNGDISMEELEAVCVEIGRERKSITASLKDLDSVVSKLDDVFVFIVIVITLLVFISLISTSAAGVLTSAGSAVLALSWLFSATAQEFLQSVIFVFVKHPFDVGDRVGIYGNTGALGRGDDYFVKEIALLYTEFKKMEGHVVQAPNSYLNTLFILNQRRSGALAEAVPVVIKFGTTLDQIDQLRQRLLEFVRAEKREYQSNILTELREVSEVHSLTLNVVFFYKSNWQNELLRLQRRNKFICALMISMQESGIEGPRMRFPGQKESFPVYLQNLPHQQTPGVGHNGTPDNPNGMLHQQSQEEPFVAPAPDMDGAADGSVPPHRRASILRNGAGAGRSRGESMAAMGRRVDFSLGMRDMSHSDMPGDVFEERETQALNKATMVRVTSPSRHSQDRSRASQEGGRSTSISDRPRQFGRLQRVNTDNSQARERSSHRNRFFGRSRNRDEETGMADIPEAVYDSSETRGDKLDPRSGLVSPMAMRSADDTRAPQSSGALPNTGEEQAFSRPSRAQTDTFEMRRLH